jgi:hypothetical protein
VEAGAISPRELSDFLWGQMALIPVSCSAMWTAWRGAVGRGSVWIPWPGQADSGSGGGYLGSLHCLVSSTCLQVGQGAAVD